MAEWLGNGLQNHAQQFDSAWHLDLLVISFTMVCKTMHSSSILLGTSTYWLLVLVLLIMWLV